MQRRHTNNLPYETKLHRTQKNIRQYFYLKPWKTRLSSDVATIPCNVRQSFNTELGIRYKNLAVATIPCHMRQSFTSELGIRKKKINTNLEYDTKIRRCNNPKQYETKLHHKTWNTRQEPRRCNNSRTLQHEAILQPPSP